MMALGWIRRFICNSCIHGLWVGSYEKIVGANKAGKHKTETENCALLGEAQSGGHHAVDIANCTNKTVLYDGKGARKAGIAV